MSGVTFQDLPRVTRTYRTPTGELPRKVLPRNGPNAPGSARPDAEIGGEWEASQGVGVKKYSDLVRFAQIYSDGPRRVHVAEVHAVQNRCN